MIIYFNPDYDSSVFLTAEDCGLGKVYCGKSALLGELELRAGLTCAEVEHSERVIAYMDAMLEAQGEGSLFYSESFRLDDYGTAELMLGWRDSLVKAGWDGKLVGESEKIKVLSLIESRFDCPGLADRWRSIIAVAAERPILKPTDRIEVQCAEDNLEPALRKLFDSINSNYASPVVEYRSVACPVSDKDGGLVTRCKVFEFDDEYVAHEWIASQNLGEEDVVAEADEALLGDIIHTLGKPDIGAADEGIGAVMRLLPLGLSLFRYPADIASLRSYLQSPVSPLGILYTKKEKTDGTPYYSNAARQLFDHICTEGGFGPGWDKILQEALYTFDGELVSEKDRDAALRFIGMWNHGKGLASGQAAVKEVVAFVKALDKWAGKKVNPESGLNAQFLALQSQCKAMLRLLGRCDAGTVSVERLNRWASHICVPIKIKSDYARLGSMNVVGNVADIFSKAKRLVWFASTTENGVPYEYDFLSPSEVAALKAGGVNIPAMESVPVYDKAYKLEGLSRCEDVTIVTCRRISGVEPSMSALLAEILACPGAEPVKGIPVEKTETDSVETDHGQAAVHKFNPKILDGFARKSESYSSIDTLLMRPLDYLLDYVKEYRQYGIEEIADIQTTEGTVAHAYVEVLGNRCGHNPEAMLEMHRESYDKVLGEVLSEKGLLLCQKENRLEEKSFRESLRESVEVLLGVIIENGLAIEGFEYEMTADVPGVGPVYSKIDCLLKDPADGEYLILDFKYSFTKTYSDKIEKNRELQLAVYRKVVETGGVVTDPDGNEVEVPGRKVKLIGYYVIPKKKIFTPDDVLKENPAVKVVEREADMDICEMAVKGYAYRWSQLRKGTVEEGEGLPLPFEESDYNKQEEVYPLDRDYNNKNLKACAYGNKNITLKGRLK